MNEPRLQSKLARQAAVIKQLHLDIADLKSALRKKNEDCNSLKSLMTILNPSDLLQWKAMRGYEVPE